MRDFHKKPLTEWGVANLAAETSGVACLIASDGTVDRFVPTANLRRTLRAILRLGSGHCTEFLQEPHEHPHERVTELLREYYDQQGCLPRGQTAAGQ